MALLFMDGFNSGDFAIKWSVVSGTTSTTGPRFAGGRHWSSSSGAVSVSRDIPASSQITVGFATNATFSNQQPFVSFYGDSAITQHISVARNTTSGFLELRRGSTGGTLLATGTNVLLADTWNYIEVQVTIADAGGVVTVRVNGNTAPDISFTGDTRNGGTSTNIDRVVFGSTTGGSSVYIDDVYILNSTGTTNTTFLGDVRVQSIIPTGNGNRSQLLGSDADSVNNYQLVDEQPYSTTDYVGSPTVGQGDTYGMSDLAAGTTQVFGIQNNIVAAKSDATLASGRGVIRTGGTDYFGASQVLTTSYITYRDVYDQNPDTSANWTVSDVNGIEGGFEVA
jgi:hypothetical protein